MILKTKINHDFLSPPADITGENQLSEKLQVMMGGIPLIIHTEPTQGRPKHEDSAVTTGKS